MSASTQSPIIIHHLQNSRSQRILWLLEELQLPYQVKRYERVNGLAPPELKQVHPLGKSPVITDNGRTVAETGAIVEYLLEKYDTKKQFQPQNEQQKADTTFWMHWAEGSAMTPLVLTLVMNGIDAKAPFFVKPIAWGITKQVRNAFLNPNLKGNFEYVESTLQQSSGEFLTGSNLTGSDFMLIFPLEAATSRAKQYVGPATVKYVETIHARPAYKRALQKGGEYAYASA